MSTTLLKPIQAAGFVVLLTLAASFQPASAQDAPSHLPLAVGKVWAMHSDNWLSDISFEVLAYEDGAYRVRMVNPWIFWEYEFVAHRNRVYMQTFSVEASVFNFGGYSRFFDFDFGVGDSVDSLLGPVTVVSTDKTVTTAFATYTNCIEISQVSDNGFEQRWTLAPDVGFVEYQLGEGVFYLDESQSVLTGTPETFELPPAPAEPRGDRILAIDISNTGNGDYLAALAKGLNAGMDEIGMLFEWNQVETSPGVYDLGYLDVADGYFASLGLSLNLTLAPIHNGRNAIPADLQGLPLDHPDLIARYEALLDEVFAKLPNIPFSSLVIGSEIEGFLQTDPVKWQQYENFFVAVADYARSQRPGLVVTTEVQFFLGYLGPNRDRVMSIMQHADAVGVSYYPLDLSGDVLAPEFVALHFDMLRNAFPGKPINFYQIGYPSSPDIESSEALQAQFVAEVFRAWDEHRDDIKLVDFTWLHDKSPVEVAWILQQFGQEAASFAAFIGSLGLRTYDGAGADKLAFPTLETEAAARGW